MIYIYYLVKLLYALNLFTIVGEDAIRSIAAAIFSLGAEEVLVIGHTECGMAGSDPDKLRNAMIERGIPQEEIDKVDLKS